MYTNIIAMNTVIKKSSYSQVKSMLVKEQKVLALLPDMEPSKAACRTAAPMPGAVISNPVIN